MIILAMYLFTIAAEWMNIINLYNRWREIDYGNFRRWWVKPHITEQWREIHGLYNALFFYFMHNDHEEFYEMARMTPEQFNLLYRMIEHRLEKFSLRRPLPKRLRLILTLNFLAHGDSTKTTSTLFYIGRSTTYKIVHEVCSVIWDCLSPRYLAVKDSFDWQIVARSYFEKWNFPNCLGAVDGKEIRIKKPPHSGSLFWNYKKFFSFKLLAACDAHLRFTWIDVGDYGSVSDASAFLYTDLYTALENNELDLPAAAAIPRTNIVVPYAFIGDAIFPFRNYLMKPFDRNHRLTERQIYYNYRLSRARNTIENAFGLLGNKWNILKNDMDFKLTNSITIVQALVCLHNFLITDELLLDEDNRMYADRDVRGNGEEDGRPIFEEFNVPANVFAQRNLLADYFNSEEGALR